MSGLLSNFLISSPSACRHPDRFSLDSIPVLLVGILLYNEVLAVIVTHRMYDSLLTRSAASISSCLKWRSIDE